MPQSAFLRTFLESTPPKNIRLAAAQGLAPLTPSDMLQLLVHLLQDPDPEVAAPAATSIAAWEESDIVAQAQARDCSALVLDYFAAESSSEVVQEAIILNPSASGKAITALASRVSAPLLETILYNRVRLIQNPQILNGVKNNPAITKPIQVLVQEIEEEFFGSKRMEYVIETPVEAAAVQEEAIAIEEEEPPDDLSLEGLPLDPNERETALFQRIAAMTVQQRIRLAHLGTREARAILIRDANRDVARSVLQSPKLTDAEVETFSAMRNVSDDVLRQVGTSKEWIKSYGVVQNLVKNPRTPPMIAQHLLFRLRTRDLSLVVRDRGVPEAVRRNAQRTLAARSAAAQRTTR
ncbi:MAG: HEAT repeat domain-containing protein [Acidobacteriota bacterium]